MKVISPKNYARALVIMPQWKVAVRVINRDIAI